MKKDTAHLISWVGVHDLCVNNGIVGQHVLALLSMHMGLLVENETESYVLPLW
jgi:hypothetical protein